MSWSQSAGIAVDAIKSLSPQAQRDKKWAETARGMEVAKYASTMRSNRLKNEAAEIAMQRQKAEDAALDKYQQASTMQAEIETFLATPGLDSMPEADRVALLETQASKLEDPRAQQAFKESVVSGDYKTLDGRIDQMVGNLNNRFGKDIKREGKGWFKTPSGEVEYLRKDSRLALEPAAEWEIERKQAADGWGGPDVETQIVDNRMVFKTGPKAGTSEAISGLTEKEIGELDTAEVNLAWKSLAATGKLGSEFSAKTRKHMGGVTQEEALKREEVGKAGLYEPKPLPTKAQNLGINKTWQELDSHIDNLDTMVADLEEDPSLAGLPGAIRKGAQTTLGIMDDLVQHVPVIGDMLNAVSKISQEMSESEKKEFGHSDKLSKVRIFENDLAWALARARQPEGRILAKNYDAAKADAKITGLTSSKDVIARIKHISSQLKKARTNQEELSEGEGAKDVIKEVNWEDL